MKRSLSLFVLLALVLFVTTCAVADAATVEERLAELLGRTNEITVELNSIKNELNALRSELRNSGTNIEVKENILYGTDFAIEVITNSWYLNSSFGESLFVPYLKLSVTNNSGKSVDRITIKTVFYDLEEKSIWSDETDYLVSSSDTALKNGYSKTAYISSSVGYRRKISESSLPKITAEVFINDELFGEFTINNVYSN